MLVDKKVGSIFTSGKDLVITMNNGTKVIVQFIQQDAEYIYGSMVSDVDEMELRRFGFENPNQNDLVNNDEGCAILKSGISIIQVRK